MSNVIRINQIKLPVSHSEKDLERAICKALYLKNNQTVIQYSIVKKSIDARDKNRLLYIYSVSIELNSGQASKDSAELDSGQASEINAQLKKNMSRYMKDKNIVLAESAKYNFDRQTKMLYASEIDSCINRKTAMINQPIIVGTGPAGLFCGYMLAKAGYHPILIERGKSVEARKQQIEAYWEGAPLNEACNVQFGEGGAGTFSDGKLNTMIKDRYGRIDEVLRIFTEFGADSDILYVNKPHIGTDVLQNVIQNMREAIITAGGLVLFDTCLVDVEFDDKGNRVVGVQVEQSGILRSIPCDCLVLALGHSARDTFYRIRERGIYMTPKAFAIGLRIEHPAEMIQRSQYGISKDASLLPAADYKLTHQTEEGRAVYSFCMCPGGHIVDASSEKNRIAVNGMSYRGRDARNSNSAIVVNVTPEDFEHEMKASIQENPLLGIEFQRKWEGAAYLAGQGKVPLQLFGDYQRNVKSSSIGAITPDIKGQYSLSNLNDCLPDFVNNAIIKGIMSFEHRIQGFSREDAVLCGVESRTSSPVRIDRDEYFQSNIRGIFPCGEGAGYAGGITSAAVDGIKVAEAIVAQYSR